MKKLITAALLVCITVISVNSLAAELINPSFELSGDGLDGWTSGAELKEKYGKAYIDFFENPFDHPVPGEGSFQNAMDRALEGFEALAERHKGQNVAIVSHGGLLRVMLVGLLGMGDEFYRKTWMTNTSVTMVDVMEDGRKLLMTLNDKAHLEMAELFEKGEEK